MQNAAKAVCHFLYLCLFVKTKCTYKRVPVIADVILHHGIVVQVRSRFLRRRFIGTGESVIHVTEYSFLLTEHQASGEYCKYDIVLD